MTTAQRYYQLKELSDNKWQEAQEMVSREEDRQNRIRIANHGEIRKEDEAEWMRVLADAYALQQEAIKLEKEAAEAQVKMWEEQYMGDLFDSKEKLQMESELRNQ